METELAFDFSDEQENLKAIFYAVFDLMKDEEVSISKIEHKPYHEIYYFEKGNESIKIKINYKKEFKISSIQSITESNLALSLSEKVKLIENKIVIIDDLENSLEIDQKDFVFPDDKPFLQKFFEEIKFKANQQKIEIVAIEHKPYHEIYKFQKGNFVAFYKFWYNGQGRFGNIEIIANRTTGLIPDINSFLNLNH